LSEAGASLIGQLAVLGAGVMGAGSCTGAGSSAAVGSGAEGGKSPSAPRCTSTAKLVDINFYISLHFKSNDVVRSKTLQNIFYSLEQSV
jgi:hypothetical protein